MDVMRRAYPTTMRFFREDALEIPVRWYRAPSSAKLFPGLNAFGTSIWDDQRLANPNDGVGEIRKDFQAWNRGITPPGITGQSFCGTIEDFELGLPPPVPLAGGALGLIGPATGTADAFGIPSCCRGPLRTALVLTGGQVRAAGRLGLTIPVPAPIVLTSSTPAAGALGLTARPSSFPIVLTSSTPAAGRLVLPVPAPAPIVLT